MSIETDLPQVEPAPTQTPSPQRVAQSILDGFDKHYSLFRYCAQRAKILFENADWLGIQRLAKERIEYYDARVKECVIKLEQLYHASQLHDDVWGNVKQEFVDLLAHHLQPDCAETFFNSVSCRLLHRDYFDNTNLFVRPAIATDYIETSPPEYRTYYPKRDGLHNSLLHMVADFGLASPFENLPRDINRVIRMGFKELRPALRAQPFPIAPDCQFQVLNSLFIRNKGAYIIGRFINHNVIYPFAIPILRNTAGKLYLDTLLSRSNEISTLFSFTRAYFLVDMEAPATYVAFLKSLLPNKPSAEFYTMLGLQKQGKTLFYRDFLHHLSHSHDKFIVAPGIKGMVMLVFTLPSYPYVFKMIKDHIAKEGMDQQTVERKYQLVKQHDRVGRMADTWEYSQVSLPLSRFDPDLLKELHTLAPTQIEEVGDSLIIRHVYIERWMTPLNLFLLQSKETQREHAIREYGNAVKELAAANIFPGDMLFKNFGVTRLGRVVFYDYDEIQYMTEMNFRRIPPAPNEEAEMASEPWYAIGANDVFPEEFGTFLLGDPKTRQLFMKYHADLLDKDFWEKCKQSAQLGRFEDIFPYAIEKRFTKIYRSSLR